MATFKIRDLMVAVRPGLQTPQRPVALDECGDDTNTFICEAAPFDSGGGGGCDDCTFTQDCEGCTNPSNPCGPCTNGDSCGGCTRTCQGCTQTCGCTRTCGHTCGGRTGGGCNFHTIGEPPIIAQMAGSQLASLKAQLRAAMQQVSRRESVLAAAAEARAVVPQTLAQVDALEQKLTEAMDELRTRRAEIQKAAGASDTKSGETK